MKWKRTYLHASPRPCGLCTSTDVVIVKAETVRTGLAALNPRWRPGVRLYDRCQSCGAKSRNIAELQPA